MKHSNISVEFKDELKELKNKLSNLGAKNLNIRKSYSGDYEISFFVRCTDSKSEIKEILESCGAKNVSSYDNYSGARFDYSLDDKVDEREIKKLIQDKLRRKNYRSY